MLDAGASGIVIAHCESAQEVKEMVDKVNFRTDHTPLLVA